MFARHRALALIVFVAGLATSAGALSPPTGTKTRVLDESTGNVLSPSPKPRVPRAVPFWHAPAPDGTRELEVTVVDDDRAPVRAPVVLEMSLGCDASFDVVALRGTIRAGAGSDRIEIELVDGVGRVRTHGVPDGCAVDGRAVEGTAAYLGAPAPGAAPALSPPPSSGFASEIELPDPGQAVVGASSWTLPFVPHDVEFDPRRPYLYASDREGRRVVFFNLETGSVEREFLLDRKPEALTLSLDGNRLFAAMVVQDHSPYWRDEDGHEGYVASWDLIAGVKDREFRIVEDPFDIAISGDSALLVTSGSGQYTYMRAFDPRDGTLLGSNGSPYERSRMLVHPSQYRVYLARPWSTYWLERYDYLYSTGQIATRWNAQPTAYAEGAGVFPTPDWGSLLLHDGRTLSSADTSAGDLQFLGRLTDRSVFGSVADVEHGVLFTIESESIVYYNARSSLPIGEFYDGRTARWLGLSAGSVAAVYPTGEGADVVVRPHPAPEVPTDASPTAALVASPAAGFTTDTEINFDASGSSDNDDAAESLTYRWDLDGDGAWDGPFTSQSTRTTRYRLPGSYEVRVQVRDPLGAADESSIRIDVEFAPTTGEVPVTHAPFDLPLGVTEAIFDPDRPIVHLLDAARQRVYVMDRRTGRVTSQFQLERRPVAADLDRESGRLVVVLAEQACQSTYDCPHSGWLASIDVDQDPPLFDRMSWIDQNPQDVAVVSRGRAAVSSWYAGYEGLRLRDTTTGGALDGYSYLPSPVTGLRARPGGAYVYAFSVSESYTSVYRFPVNPSGYLEYGTSVRSVQGGDLRAGLWFSPAGNVAVTRAGRVLAFEPSVAQDLARVASFGVSTIEAVDFDPSRHLLFTGEAGAVRWYNDSTYLDVGAIPTFATPIAVFVEPDRAWALSSDGSRTRLESFPHPAPDAATNLPPIPSAIVANPGDATTRRPVILDASGSYDPDGLPAELRFRWDFDADGIWDTPFRSTAQEPHLYDVAGSKRVRMEVRDRLGVTSIAMLTVAVPHEPAPGEPADAPFPFLLPFDAEAIVLDPLRGRLYAADGAGRTLAVVGLESGLIETEIPLERDPTVLAMAPDGGTLFVGMTPSAEDRALPGGDTKGRIATIDLDAPSLLRSVIVDDDPATLVADAYGRVLGTSAKLYRSGIRVFDSETGATVYTFSNAGYGTRIALDPASGRMYGVSSSVSGSVTRSDLRADGSIVQRWEWPYSYGKYSTGGDVWVSPDGASVLVRAGYAFTTGDDRTSDLFWKGTASGMGAAIAWDLPHHTMASATTGGVRFYNTDSWVDFYFAPFATSPTRVGIAGDRAYAFFPQSDGTLVRTILHPGPSGDSNTPPVARFVVVGSASTAAPVRIDASTSSDEQTPTSQLRYRWDFESDGTWDTAFSTTPVTEFTASVRGTRVVTLQVVDGNGASDLVTRHVDVTYAPKAGQTPDPNPPFVLPFEVLGVVAPGTGGKVWAATTVPRSVASFDPATGFVVDVVPLSKEPVAIALSADGAKILVACKGWDRLPNGVTEIPDGLKGRLARLDAASGAIEANLEIDVLPSDLATLDESRVVVADETSYDVQPFLKVVSIADGSTLSSTRGGWDYGGYQVRVHPSGTRVYVESKGSSAPDIRRFDLDPSGTFVLTATHRGQQYVDSGRPYLSPDGGWLFRSSGAVLRLSPDPSADMAPTATLDGTNYWAIDFDVARKTVYAGRAGLATFHHSESFLEFASFSVPGTPAFGFFRGDFVLSLVLGYRTTTVSKVPHPAPDGDRNSTPVPRLSLTPNDGRTTVADYLGDASSSEDAESSADRLVFRWDLDGDGTWDTPFDADPRIELRHDLPGSKRLVVQVRDPYGAAAAASVDYDVTFAPDPGRVPEPNTPWRFPFRTWDVETDPNGPWLFLTDREGRRLVVVDGRTGGAVREFRFVHYPERMTLSPDGTRLFVNVVNRDAFPSGNKEQGGEFASFDLTTLTKDRQFHVEGDPWDFGITRDGRIVANDATSYWEPIKIFDATTGEKLGAYRAAGNKYRVQLHPSDGFFYEAPDVSSSSSVQRYNLGPGSTVISGWSKYVGSTVGPGRIWLSPNGDFMVLGDGSLRRPGDSYTNDLADWSRPFTQAVAAVWDAAMGEVYVVHESTATRVDAPSGLAEADYPIQSSPSFLGKIGKKLVAVYWYATPKETRFDFADANHAPTAILAEIPEVECDGGRGATLRLDGTGSFDPDDRSWSEPDITTYAWTVDGQPAAAGRVTSARAGIGDHHVTLVVTDASGATADASGSVSVVDTVPPSGAVVAPAPGACFGPAGIPVAVVDGFTDLCDPDLVRSYDPPGGPAYSSHGDVAVRVVAADAAGNTVDGSTAFTIDLVPPVVSITEPKGSTIVPDRIPLDILFSSTDADGAAGGVLRERIYLDDCLLYDGASYGDGDGLLTDETVVLDERILCVARAACGHAEWPDPTIRVTAVDCGGNQGTGSVPLHGTIRVGPEDCD